MKRLLSRGIIFLMILLMAVTTVMPAQILAASETEDVLTHEETEQNEGNPGDEELTLGEQSTTLADDTIDLTILHTNDLHSRIDDLGKVAAYIFAEREKAEHSLYLDAGDIFTGAPVNDINLGKPIIDILNAMELDAMAIGNHEFDYGQYDFAERVKDSNFPWLSANMRVTGDIPIEQPEPYMLFEFDDFTVAVFSLLQSPPATAPSGIVGLEFDGYVETALKYKDELEEQADVIIALTHIGYQDDFKLAEEVDYFDAIIGGHSHTVLAPREVNGTTVTQAGSYASHVGKLNLSIDPETKEVVEVSGELTAVNSLEETDEEVQAIIDRWNGQMDEILAQVIGESDTGLSRDVRYEQDAPLGNFWTDAMVYATPGAEIAFTNNGGIRDSIAPGEITVGDIYRVEPFDNQVMLMEMTGQAIKDVIEYSYTRDGRNQIDLQTSGLHYTILTNNVYEYVDAVIEVNGEPLDLEKKYKVAVSDFLGNGGSGYNFVGEVLYPEVTPMTTAMIMYAEELTKAGGKINYDSEGRIAIDIDPNADLVGNSIGKTENGLYSENKGKMDVGIGNLYTDAIRAETDADIGLLNGTSVTKKIIPGTITDEQIKAMDSFGNKIVVVETTGARLKEMILSQSNFHGGVDIQASGIRYTLVKDTEQNKFTDVVIFLEDGSPIQDDAVYTVAYNDFMHNGGHYTLNDETIVADGGLVTEAVVAYVSSQNNRPIDYEEGKRIRIQDQSDFIVVGDILTVADEAIAGDSLIINLEEVEFEVSEIYLTASQIAKLKENESTIIVQNGAFKVEIPASLLGGEDDVRFKFEKVNEVDEEELEKVGKLVSEIYDFTIVEGEAVLADFGANEVTVELSVMEKVNNDENLAIYFLDEEKGEWVELGGTYADGSVKVSTNHFTKFAVFANAAEDPITPGDDDHDGTDDDQDGDKDGKLGDKSGKDSQDDDKKKSTGDSKKKAEGKKLPKTATDLFNWILAGVILLAAGALVYLIQRKKQFTK